MKPDAEGSAGRVDGAGKDVETSEIRAEEMDEALVDPEQPDVHRDQSEQPVGLAVDEEPDRPDLARIDGVLQSQRDHVALGLAAVDEGPKMERAVLLEETRRHRRAGHVCRVALVGRIGADHLGEEHEDHEDAEEAEADHRHPVAAELPPHQLPLAREVRAGGSRCGRRRNVRSVSARLTCRPSFEPDPRIEQHEQHVGDQRSDDCQHAVDEDHRARRAACPD